MKYIPTCKKRGGLCLLKIICQPEKHQIAGECQCLAYFVYATLGAFLVQGKSAMLGLFQKQQADQWTKELQPGGG